MWCARQCATKVGTIVHAALCVCLMTMAQAYWACIGGCRRCCMEASLSRQCALVATRCALAAAPFLSLRLTCAVLKFFRSRLVDENGKLSQGRTLLAGLGAGVTEAIFAVTPMETAK